MRKLKWQLKANIDERFNGNIIISFENRVRNNTTKECVIVRKKGSKVAPLVWFDTIVDMYNNCSSVDAIIDYLVKLTTQDPPFDPEKVEFTKEALQQNLRLMLISSEHNTELMKTVPYVSVPDTDLIVIMKYDCGQGYIVTITNELMRQSIDISVSEMFEIAFKNLAEQKIIFRSLAEVIDEPECDSMPLYVLQAGFISIGAAIILKPGCLDYVRNAIGDFYILPSSVCEVLVLSKYYVGVNVKKLIDIVRTINQETVLPEDRLSDNIYEYDGELRMVEVNAYE